MSDTNFLIVKLYYAFELEKRNKKMFSSRKKSASIFSIISYTEPKLHTGKTWYIDFKSYDPVEQKMKRKK